MRQRLSGLLAMLVLLSLVLGCFARLVARPGGILVDGQRPSVDGSQRSRTIGNDQTRLFLPHHLRIAERIHRTGRLPLWDPFGFGGRPLVGNPQAGLWYPPVWLVWWTRLPSALSWLLVAHLCWAGLGTYWLARALGMSRWPAIIAGGCFEAAPYLLAQSFEGHVPHVWAASWYPWAFLAALAIQRGHRLGALMLPPILALAFLVGHPQEAYYLALALGIWGLVAVVQNLSQHRARSAWLLSGRWGLALLLATGLVTIELVPDLAVRPWAQHGGPLSLKQASHYHPDPINLLQLFSSRALGGPAEYVGPFNYWESLLSFGWVPLVLAVLAVSKSPRRATARGWLALAVGSVVVAAGPKLGLFLFFYEAVPGMALFRVPARALFLASLGVAMLAGLGVETIASGAGDWQASERRYRRFLILLLIGLAGGRLAAQRLPAAEPLATHAQHPSELNRLLLGVRLLTADPMFWLALGGTSAGVWVLCRRPHRHRATAFGLGALALVELGVNGFGLLRTSPPEQFVGPDPVSTAIAKVAPAGPFRIRARDSFYGDLPAAVHGFEKTNVNDFFQLQHAADLYEQLYHLLGPIRPGGAQSWDSGPVPAALVQAVLDRMNVALLVTDQPEPGAPWPAVASGSWDNTPFTIYRNPSALPRAYVVPRAEVVDDDATVVSRLASINPRTAVAMSSDPLGDTGPRQTFTPASYDPSDPDRVVIKVATRAPGLLVVADTWLPGWSARVDGQRVSILRGNHSQRVVSLPVAGEHLVEMRYQPPGLILGWAVTMLTTLLWLGVTFLAMRKRPVSIPIRNAQVRRPHRVRTKPRTQPA